MRNCERMPDDRPQTTDHNVRVFAKEKYYKFDKVFLRISTSTCVRRLFWFGTPKADSKNSPLDDNFSKEAKVAPAQVRSHAGCGGESNAFKNQTKKENAHKQC